MKDNTVHAGPRSVRLWIDEAGRIGGIEWHCPPGQCREHQDAVCPHAVLNNGTVLCNDVQQCKMAMMTWAESTFLGFSDLYRERA